VSGNPEKFGYAVYPRATRDFACSINGLSLSKYIRNRIPPNHGNRGDLQQITRPFKMCALSDAIGEKWTDLSEAAARSRWLQLILAPLIYCDPRRWCHGAIPDDATDRLKEQASV